MLAALAALAIAMPLVVFPLGQPSRADETFWADDQESLEAALEACEGLASGATCTIEITDDIDVSPLSGDFEYSGLAHLRLLGTNGRPTISGEGAPGKWFLRDYSHADLTVENLAIDSGGALWVSASTVSIDSSMFLGNTAASNGGAIYISNGANQLTVTNSTFNGNSAESGGGAIHSIGSAVDVSNSTFIANDSNGPDGGFSDVPADHPFFKEVEWLVSTGITSGYDDGTFQPSSSITCQAIAAFLYRYVLLSVG